MKNKKGFTLIELLIVIGVIAVLMAIAVVAINPGRQFAKANNAKRWGDVGAIANAIAIKIIEDKGSWDRTGTTNCEDLLAITDGVAYPLAWDDVVGGNDPNVVDICDCLVYDYFGSMPLDPTPTAGIAPVTAPCGITADATKYDSGYEISRNSAGRITISAPNAQDETGSGAPTISVTR